MGDTNEYTVHDLVRDELYKNMDVEYGKFTASLSPGAGNIIGVRILCTSSADVGYFEVWHAFSKFHNLVVIDAVVGCQVPAEVFGQYRSGADGDVPTFIGYFSHIHQHILHTRG